MAGLLEDKVALVTGAGRGIGRGVARLLAEEGAAVLVNDPGVELDGAGGSSGPADEVVAEIEAAGGRAAASYASVTDFTAAGELVEQAVESLGGLDIVVTCQGILRDRMIFNMTHDEWEEVVTVHLTGTFNVVRHAAAHMRRQRAGRIITFTSSSGLIGNPGQANYGAAKAGISGLTKVAARDLGRYGVTCNAICPVAATRMTASVSDEARERRAQRGIQRAETGGAAPPRFDPDDVAPMVAYLASDLAGNVNGQFFYVYGNTISLLSQPRLERSALRPEGFWSVEELRTLMPETILKDVPNPAPPRAEQRAGGPQEAR